MVVLHIPKIYDVIESQYPIIVCISAYISIKISFFFSDLFSEPSKKILEDKFKDPQRSQLEQLG